MVDAEDRKHADQVYQDLDIDPVLQKEIERVARREDKMPWDVVKRRTQVSVARDHYRDKHGGDAPSDAEAVKEFYDDLE